MGVAYRTPYTTRAAVTVQQVKKTWVGAGNKTNLDHGQTIVIVNLLGLLHQCRFNKVRVHIEMLELNMKKG